MYLISGAIETRMPAIMQSSRFKYDDPNFYLLRGDDDSRTKVCERNLMPIITKRYRNSTESGNASVFVENFARIQMDSEDFGPPDVERNWPP